MVAIERNDIDDGSLAAEADAEECGLRYVSDASFGIRRRRQGKGFSYTAPGGSTPNPRQMQRIQSLFIPPAWHDVWICLSPNGHIRAAGRDPRGRKQYIYHPDWRAHRDAGKFESLAHFARLLPRIRRRVTDGHAGSEPRTREAVA